MADTSIANKWVRHLRNHDGREQESLNSDVAYKDLYCLDSGSHLEDEESPCLQCHLQRRPPLVSEVTAIYAGLAKMEETCTQIDKGQSRNSETNPDLNLEQWKALEAVHHTLLYDHHDLPVAFSSLSPVLRRCRKIAHDHSLQSQTLRRFSDCTIPLLKREQDLESARQWLELMKLSSSLIEILGKNELLFFDEEMALMDLIEQIEAILSRLRLWFRRKYEDLSRKKDVMEEQGLTEPVFEFPNNIRHTCTTMPWIILPALLILWGVCWMFIIGSSQPEREWGNAADPIVSPVPAAHDFHADFYGVGIKEGPQASVADGFDDRRYLSQDTLEELWAQDVELMNELIHPLTFAQTIPQDPNFLNPDMISRGDSESLELASQDTAEILPAAAMEESAPTARISAENGGERNATGSVDGSGQGHRKINSDETEKTKSRFVCPDCQQTFARPFILSRHRIEQHKHASSWEEPLLCPNPGCKRSNGKTFKRRSHLTRHIKSCKHGPEDLSRRNDQSCPRSTSTSSSASASIQHSQDVGPNEAIRANGMKRPRAEDAEESNDEFLLAEMVKKYKKLEKEIKEKQDGLKALEKTIQMLKGSLRNS